MPVYVSFIYILKRENMQRNELVIVYINKQTGTGYCNACSNYIGNIHGSCPDNTKYFFCVKSFSFDNTKHIPIAIRGQICKGQEHNCLADCNRCVIAKRGYVLPPQK